MRVRNRDVEHNKQDSSTNQKIYSSAFTTRNKQKQNSLCSHETENKDIEKDGRETLQNLLNMYQSCLGTRHPQRTRREEGLLNSRGGEGDI